MKRFILSAVLGTLSLGTVPTAQAKHHHHDYDRDRWRDHGHTRSIYVIENHRPVRRVVYVDGDRYYRYFGGRRVYVTGRYFTSYPSQYYYSDGRPRVGVSIAF
jgi:hypothetical protein